jgi:hypothetical protein
MIAASSRRERKMDGMAAEVQALIPVEEYLSTTYSPDREYRDGVLVESELWTRYGSASVPDHTLRIPDTAIAIPLLEVMAQ